jgi:DNA-binding MarR family transcriptional regulator
MDETPAESDNARIAALATEVRLLAGRLRRRLVEQASGGDFTPSQISVLIRLENEGPQTVTALARAAGVRPQSMGATVAVLEASGLVAGAPDPTDGRQTILSLTDACREWVQANRAAREDWLFRSIQTTLTASEQLDLATGVELLKRLVNS